MTDITELLGKIVITPRGDKWALAFEGADENISRLIGTPFETFEQAEWFASQFPAMLEALAACVAEVRLGAKSASRKLPCGLTVAVDDKFDIDIAGFGTTKRVRRGAS